MMGGMMRGIFDWTYLLFLIPPMLLTLYAKWKVKRTYKKYAEVKAKNGITGKEVAEMILEESGIDNVKVEQVNGFLTDHYSPSEKKLRLSPTNFSGDSVAAFGVAAHEVGHAIQDKERYGPLVIRSAIAKPCAYSASIGLPMIIIGMMLAAMIGTVGKIIIWVGIVIFAASVFFQLITLPVEFHASARALGCLFKLDLVDKGEIKDIRRVLNAAALTYVAAAATAVMQLAYFLMKASQMSSR